MESPLRAEFQAIYLSAPQEHLREFALGINAMGSVLLAGQGADLKSNPAQTSRGAYLDLPPFPFREQRFMPMRHVGSSYAIERSSTIFAPFLYVWSQEKEFQPVGHLCFYGENLFFPKINNSGEIGALGFRRGFSTKAILVISDSEGHCREFPQTDQWDSPDLQPHPSVGFKPKQALSHAHSRLDCCLVAMNDCGHLLLKTFSANDHVKSLIWDGYKMVHLKQAKDVYKINNRNRLLYRERFSHFISILKLEDGSSREAFKAAGMMITGFNDREEVVGIEVTSKDRFQRKGFYWSAERDWIALDFWPIALNNRGEVLGVKMANGLTGEEFEAIRHLIKGDYLKYGDSNFWDCWMGLEKTWCIWDPEKGCSEIKLQNGDEIVFLHAWNDRGEIVGEVVGEDRQFYTVLLRSR